MRKARLILALASLSLPVYTLAASTHKAAVNKAVARKAAPKKVAVRKSASPTVTPQLLPRPVPPVAPTDATAANAWRVNSGAALSDVLYDWSQRAGWTLVWDSDYRYTMDASAVFQGDFPSAVTQLFSALGTLNPPLYPALYHGNQVLVVKAQPGN